MNFSTQLLVVSRLNFDRISKVVILLHVSLYNSWDLNVYFLENRELIRSYLVDEYQTGVEELVNFCTYNEITKNELSYFISKLF